MSVGVRERQDVENDCLLLLEIAEEEYGEQVLRAMGFCPGANRALVLLRQYQDFRNKQIDRTRPDQEFDHVTIGEKFLVDLERRFQAAVNQLNEGTDPGRWHARSRSVIQGLSLGTGGRRNPQIKRGRRKMT